MSKLHGLWRQPRGNHHNDGYVGSLLDALAQTQFEITVNEGFGQVTGKQANRLINRTLSTFPNYQDVLTGSMFSIRSSAVTLKNWGSSSIRLQTAPDTLEAINGGDGPEETMVVRGVFKSFDYRKVAKTTETGDTSSVIQVGINLVDSRSTVPNPDAHNTFVYTTRDTFVPLSAVRTMVYPDNVVRAAA